MSIAVESEFRFSQYFMQDDGGWCAGISIAVITHLHENAVGGAVNPMNACMETKDYVGFLRGSYDKITGRTAPGMRPFRNAIRQLQRPFDGPFEGKPDGTYLYEFGAQGIGLLRLRVLEPADGAYGSDFLSWYSTDSSNHAGVAVWTPAGRVFLFDPNCGGLLFRWALSDQVGSFPVAVDMALRHLYGLYDRMRGARTARLVSVQQLDPNGLPYGRV
jgi:hypothetical protein